MLDLSDTTIKNKNLKLKKKKKNNLLGCILTFTFCIFQISASVNLAEENKVPKLIAESTWNLEI